MIESRPLQRSQPFINHHHYTQHTFVVSIIRRTREKEKDLEYVREEKTERETMTMMFTTTRTKTTIKNRHRRFLQIAKKALNVVVFSVLLLLSQPQTVEAKRGDPDKPKYLPSTIYYSIRQAQQMCDMPLPKGHENDGAPLLPKARVQGRVDQRALHLCQQWNFVVANRQAQGKMQGYKLKPIIPPEHFHDGYVADMDKSAEYPEAAQAQNRLGYANGDEYDEEHMNMSREIHDASGHVGTGTGNAAAFADDVLLVAGAILFGAALKHVYDSKADPFKPMANVPKFPLRPDPESGEPQKHDPSGWEKQG